MKGERHEDSSSSRTLDPDDWEQVRALGHVMLDDMIDYVRDVRERPAWQSPSYRPSTCKDTNSSLF